LKQNEKLRHPNANRNAIGMHNHKHSNRHALSTYRKLLSHRFAIRLAVAVAVISYAAPQRSGFR
jgi:hypothetical protein